MEVYEVHFLQEALDDLEEIILFIAQNNREAALRIHDEFIHRANDLSVFPKRGRLVPDTKMKNSGYRILPIYPYLAFYRIIDCNVYIYRVIHGATNYPMLYEKMIQSTNEADQLE